MNKTGIEWADLTYNPIVGCTEKKCRPWCYAYKVAQRLTCPQCRAFEPHLHPERLADLSKGKPSRVFMGSMGDMFDPQVDPDWWRQILLAHEASGFRHRLMVLTKRPDLIREKMPWTGAQIFMDTIWFGTTITCQDDDWRIKHLLQVPAAGHFVSLEPLLELVDTYDWFYCPPCDYPADHICACPTIDWLIIGGLSGSWLPEGWISKKWFLRTETGWANQIIAQAKAAGVPVFVKTKPVKLPGVEAKQEWPEGLKEE